MLKVCPVHHQFPYMGASIPNSFLEFAKLREHSSKSMQLFMSLLPTLQICTTHFNRWSKQKDLIGYVSLMWCRFTFESLNLQYCFSPFRIFFFFLPRSSLHLLYPPSTLDHLKDDLTTCAQINHFISPHLLQTNVNKTLHFYLFFNEPFNKSEVIQFILCAQVIQVHLCLRKKDKKVNTDFRWWKMYKTKMTVHHSLTEEMSVTMK